MCECLFVCVFKSIIVPMYYKALFSDHRLCRAISSPYSNKNHNQHCFSSIIKKNREKKEHQKVKEESALGPELLGPQSTERPKKREKSL